MARKSRSRKSGREKLENPPEGLPKVVSVPAKFQKQMEGKRVFYPSPLERTYKPLRFLTVPYVMAPVLGLITLAPHVGQSVSEDV